MRRVGHRLVARLSEKQRMFSNRVLYLRRNVCPAQGPVVPLHNTKVYHHRPRLMYRHPVLAATTGSGGTFRQTPRGHLPLTEQAVFH